MFLTYGLNEQGEYVSIDEVDKGKSHLQCPFCKVALIAKKGDVRDHHFSHAGITCQKSKVATESTSIPMYDSEEFLNPNELKLIDRVTRYKDVYWWKGKDKAANDLALMGILKSEVSRSEALTTTLSKIRDLDSSLVDENLNISDKLSCVFDALSNIGIDVQSEIQSEQNERLSVNQDYLRLIRSRSCSIANIDKYQRFSILAKDKKLKEEEEGVESLFREKVKHLNRCDLYVMSFVADIEGMPDRFIKIGKTSRDSKIRLSEVVNQLSQKGVVHESKVLLVLKSYGRMEKALHRKYSTYATALNEYFAMDWDKLDLLLWELAQLKTGAISLP
ncbi:hypothetical protein NDJ00_11940 [Vibrio parahaemolyticus]|uniref:GIY-YIG nuclease family protein n=1 Tax=Vibrio parahaemolyticus TaxID=670 RepID=UPI00215EE2D7|nr:GIY-YIG nuclease family protein [Vibrio parahaemolyticus]MCS0114882.1 hypothetical protein [Vibrio parahaemolyticus]